HTRCKRTRYDTEVGLGAPFSLGETNGTRAFIGAGAKVGTNTKFRFELIMSPNSNLGDFPFEEANRHLVEAAIRNEAVLAKSASEMRELERMLGERVRGLPDWIAAEVDRRLAEAVRRTAVEVTKRLSDANDAATRAHAA